jgi:hypothetical protein
MKVEFLKDAVEHVKKRKLMYLGSEDVVPEKIAAFIANDALILKVEKIYIEHWHNWFLVRSPEDWLTYQNDFTIEETFCRLIPLVGGGANALRREILSTAFASDVFTMKGGKIIVIKGEHPIDAGLTNLLKSIPDSYRVVGFRVSKE